MVPLFNSLVNNETSEDIEAEILGRSYVIPRESCFYMVKALSPSPFFLSSLHCIGRVVLISELCFSTLQSDLNQIQGIVPGKFLHPALVRFRIVHRLNVPIPLG